MREGEKIAEAAAVGVGFTASKLTDFSSLRHSLELDARTIGLRGRGRVPRAAEDGTRYAIGNACFVGAYLARRDER